MSATDIASPFHATPSRIYQDVLDRLYAGFSISFAEPTQTSTDAGRAAELPNTAVSRGEEYRRHERRTTATTVADPELIADLADAPELRAVEELRAWLHLTYEDVARAAGLSPSLLHHWRQRYRTGHPVRPRASTIERLWRSHALVRAIAEALEGADQGNAVRLWFRRVEDGVSPLDLLLDGDINGVERRAHTLLFDETPREIAPWRTATVEDDLELAPAPAPPLVVYDDGDFG